MSAVPRESISTSIEQDAARPMSAANKLEAVISDARIFNVSNVGTRAQTNYCNGVVVFPPRNSQLKELSNLSTLKTSMSTSF
jgi:7,8-dihydro-6-hydroxymethylpterin-pyrophosphokinase